MSDDALRVALRGLRVRVPQTREDADALRSEVRAADAALGVHLRQVVAERAARRGDGGGR